MRHNEIGSPAPPFFDNVKTRNFLGDNAAHARVTVEPAWSIKKTASIYGNSFRGPYRYYTDGNPEEYEVPSIQSVTWNRSNSQDLATATITIYNSWHNVNTETPEQTTHLGKKGYFWPKRGQGDSAATWNQESAKGAYDKDGVWHSTFSWENVLVEDALLRTYEGYGNKPTSGNYISIQDNLDNENLLITGVWIINTVSAGSDGKMTLQCTDIGRILLDQMVFPPIIPEAVYPLEYYPPGQSAFASPWGPKIKNKLPKVSNVTHNEFGQEVTTSPASKGEIFIRDASGTGDSDSTVNTAHPSSHAVDGDWNTYALSEAYATMDAGKPYWEFLPGHNASYGAGIDGLSLKTWAGGYTVYVSVLEDNFPSSPTGTSTWKGTESIPGGGIKYIKKIDVPLALPDGMEKYILIDFDNILPNDEIRSVEDGYGTTNNPAQPNTYYAQKVRLTFENLYYSHIPDGSDRYRAGIRDFVLYRNGLKLSGWTPEFEVLPWSFTMTQHPTRGYWVADSRGNVYGFGDAADYDTTGFGQIDLEGDENNRVVGMAAHPSGEGYWVLDWMGNVYAQGAASHHGDFPVPNPYVRLGQQGKVQARGIAATYTGNGYWVLYSNGGVAGFGDATPNSNFVPNTDVAIFMDSFLSSTYDTGTYIPYQIGLKGTAIASHPKKIEYIVTDGSGQVFKSVDGGPLIWQKSQGLYNRVYGSKKTAGTFKLQNLEWATDIEYTVDGDGWWIAFGSGRVASFGNATKLGKNPYVFESLGKVYEDNIIVDDVKTFIDALGFRDILWSLARDPDGTGFWVLKADGSVIAYEAEFWGKPGYEGLTGYRWHDGNFNGDWANIVKEILTWAGFLFYEPDIADDEAPSVFGLIESTGIVTDTQVPPDKFDKKTLIDVIKELTEVVGYLFRITEDGRAQYACVDTETEILTDSGWKSLDELSIEDKALSLNRENYTSTWSKINKINVYDVKNEELISIEGQSHSSLTTKNHRWWVEDARVKNPRHDGKWRTSSNLMFDDCIRTAAPYGDAPTVAIHDDSLIELIGWWMSEGHQITPRSGRITQSHIANPINTDSIYDLLLSMYGKPGSRLGQSPANWNISVQDRVTHFNLGPKIMLDIYEIAPDRIPTMKFLLSLTGSQLDLLANTALLGDGSVTEVTRDENTWGGYQRYHQPTKNNRAEARVFEIISALRGVATHTVDETKSNATRTNLLMNDRVKPVGASRNVNGSTKIEEVVYSGRVWCPTLDSNEVWLARRNGTVYFTGNSPNWWRAGNFDQNGYPIYVSSVTGERVASDDVDAIPFIPVIHEDEDMLNYNVTLSSADKRSVIYVGSDLPDAKDPTKTSYIRHVPPSSLETVSGGVNTMRGIERPAIWVSQLFENEQERKLMAELIGLHAWFGSRVGSTSIIGNPALSVDDQVRLVEQNTSETFIHLITGLNSSLDNDTGVYTMDLNTYWLGDADDWVIATEPKEASEYVYTVISNELNSWQTKTGRGLTGGGSSDTGIFTVTGEFNRTIFEVNSINEMIVLGDSLSYLDSTLNGLTGDRWPNLLENSGSVVTVKNGAFSGWTSQNLVDTPIVAPESTDALVIFVGANDQNTSLSGVTIEEYSQNLLYLLDHYPATKQLVVFPWPWTGYPPVADPAPTEVEYYGYRDAAQAAASIRGASFLDMGDVISTIVAAAGETGWGDYIVDWIHASALGHQTLAEYISSKLYVSYGDDSNWQFSGTINTIDVINSIYMRVVSLSNLGSNIFMEIYDGSDLINYVELEYAGQLISLGSLGVDGESKQYTYVINGTPVSRGGGKIKLSFSADNSSAPSVEDTLILFDSNIPAPGSEEEVVDIPTEPTTPVTTSGVMFGYSANSHSDLQANIAAGMGTPQVWRHFLSSTIDSTTAWDSGIPVHISFKPDISQPVATWSGDLENLLRREGNASGQITYVTIWHEPENDLDKPFMASAANFRRALNEVTRVCRKLTGEDAGGTFYSAPTLMDWTLNPSSGRDINDWIDLDLVDYDIIVWDPYPNDHGVIPAIDIDVAMSATNHADNIRDIMDYSVSVGKPWAIGEIGTRRYDSEMSSAGVTSYTSTQRAVYMTDLANFVTGLSTPPVYVCYFTFGDNNVLENPEKAAINAIVSA